MIVNRRRFLSAAGATGIAAALPRRARAQNDGRFFDLTAGVSPAPLLGGEGPETVLWSYGGASPGPVIRARQGELVRVRLRNELPQPTSVHWHGIRIDNAMDGVPGMTQNLVASGDSFDYSFVAPDAGTYWYHSHNKSWEQLARGLYGPLIIEEAVPLPVDREMVLVIDDWRLGEDRQIHAASFGHLHDWSHAGRLGNWLTINGVSRPDLEVRRGERLRLRLINCANARILKLNFAGLAPQLIALDGQPLPAPEGIEPDGTLTLAPAQRADLLLDVTLDPGEAVELFEASREKRIAIGRFHCRGYVEKGLAGSTLEMPPPNGLPEPDLSDPLLLEVEMAGGAMGGLRSALYQGRSLSPRELAEEGQVWALNGVAGMPEQPLARIPAGRSVLLQFRNRTAWPHAMHIHGHHFRAVARNGKTLPVAKAEPWRDTELVEREEAVSLAFVADNPGKWLVHCHMLEHQAAGMKTWFEVIG